MLLTIIYSKARDQWSFMSHEGPGAPVSKDLALQILHKMRKEIVYHIKDESEEYISWKFEV